MKSFLLVLLWGLTIVLPLVADAGIYRCRQDDGVFVYTDRACGAELRQEEQVVLHADTSFGTARQSQSKETRKSRRKDQSKGERRRGSAKKAVKLSQQQCFRKDGKGRATFTAQLYNSSRQRVRAWFTASLRVDGQLRRAPDWCTESKQVVLRPGQRRTVSVSCRRTVTERMHGSCHYNVSAKWL